MSNNNLIIGNYYLTSKRSNDVIGEAVVMSNDLVIYHLFKNNKISENRESTVEQLLKKYKVLPKERK
jgi:hypothetical protein